MEEKEEQKCCGRAKRNSDSTKEKFRRGCKTLDGNWNRKSFRKARKNSEKTKNILKKEV